MSTVYLSLPGSKLHLQAGRYRIIKNKAVLADLPSEGVTEVILLGGTQITTQAMRNLLTHRARIHLLTQSELHIGTLEPSASGRADLLRAQVRQTDDPAFRMRINKAIMTAKLENSRAVLIRWQRQHPQATMALEAAAFQRQSREKIEQTGNENELRGFEGIAAQTYFAALRELIPEAWGFHTRQRRPPPDPVNAMLSFGYTLLLTKVISAVLTSGLHPGIGCLHVTHGQRPALALDLQEEYRAALVDRYVLSLINRGQIAPQDFTYTSDGCRFSDAARDLFVRGFETRLRDQVGHRGQTTTYNRLIRAQAKSFAQVVQGEAFEYFPLRVR